MSELTRYGWQEVGPPSRPVLFVNPSSGGGKAPKAALAERARDQGIETVVLGPGDNLSQLVDEAVRRGADALGMAGGDGSLAVVADAAYRHRLPFVCLPAGTRNHFALDLGVDRHDLVGGLAAFTTGVERLVDLGEVGGRTFVNNVSIGVYGEAVAQPAYRDAKLRTLAETAQHVLGPSSGAPGLRLLDDLGAEHRDCAVVLVSNNPYALRRPFARGTRLRLDGGVLGVVVLERPGAPPPPARAWSATELTVHASAPIRAGIDGEAVELNPPVRFSCRPAALRVRISARHPGRSPSARLAAGLG